MVPGGFAAFDYLGRFQRPTLARGVFGAKLLDDAVGRICGVLASWGYRREERRLTQVICHTLLINRSPLLEDLSTAALARLRADPAMGGNLAKDFYGIHRAVAALGHVAKVVNPAHVVVVLHAHAHPHVRWPRQPWCEAPQPRRALRQYLVGVPGRRVHHRENAEDELIRDATAEVFLLR